MTALRSIASSTQPPAAELLAEAVSICLSRVFGMPARVSNLRRLFGGASRETYRAYVETVGRQREIVVRCDPVSGFVRSDRHIEFLAGLSFHGSAVPVAEPLAVQAQDNLYGRAFICHAWIDEAHAPTPYQRDPYGAHARVFGAQFFETLGRIAAADPARLPLARASEAGVARDGARAQLRYWEGEFRSAELHPQPLMRAAIRALKRHPVPASSVSVVHGDYRSGNVLHDGAGRLLAVIDWEMAHLGDPLEDLAWALSPLWTHGCAGRVGGMLAREEAIAHWEGASGRVADPAALRWWQLFAAVKGQALWTAAARQFLEGEPKDPVAGLSGWYLLRRQDEILAQMLDELETAR